jgi:hypothetical protein
LSAGRVSLLSRHFVAALPPDERHAVEMLETHLWQRQERPEPPELLDDHTVGVFLTIGHVQKLLHEIDAPKKGEDYAAEILNSILPRLGLLEATGLTKKPRVARAHPGESRETGGRHAQPTIHCSYWWRIFRLPTLSKYLASRVGAYPEHPGTCVVRPRGEASLVGLLRCQGLISVFKPGRKFGRGSVQAAFWATGPP